MFLRFPRCVAENSRGVVSNPASKFKGSVSDLAQDTEYSN
jgi:hypothetical protein